MKRFDQIRQHIHGFRLTASDRHAPVNQRLLLHQLLLCFIDQPDDFLRAAAQQNPLVRQADAPCPSLE